jgi:hypothetical protein
MAGPIPDQIDAARRRLRRWLPSAIRLGRSGRFGRDTFVPEPAWLEAIVNATIHRSSCGWWRPQSGSSCSTTGWRSRAGSPNPVSFAATTSATPRPRGARAVADPGFGREFGEGANRMYEEMGRAGLNFGVTTKL